MFGSGGYISAAGIDDPPEAPETDTDVLRSYPLVGVVMPLMGENGCCPPGGYAEPQAIDSLRGTASGAVAHPGVCVPGGGVVWWYDGNPGVIGVCSLP